VPEPGHRGVSELGADAQQGLWAANPLFESTAGGVSTAARTGAGSSAHPLRGSGGVCDITPRRLVFDTDPAAEVPCGESVGVGASPGNNMAGLYAAAGGLLGEGVAGWTGSLGAKLSWDGSAGLAFFEFRNRMEVLLWEARGKGRSAVAQLHVIRSGIQPMTPGASAHDTVVLLLMPCVEQALKGQVVAVQALVVPELEYLLGKEAGAVDLLKEVLTGGAAGRADQPDVCPMLVTRVGLLWMGRDQVVKGEAAAASASSADSDPAGAAFLRELLELGGLSQLLEAARLVPGAGELVEMLAGLLRQVAPQEPAGPLHGWRHVVGEGATADYAHPEWGVHRVADLPILVYWATMSRYFGVISAVEVMRIKSLAMKAGEDLVSFAVRLSTQADVVRAAHQANPTSVDMPESEVLEVFSKAVEASTVYAPMYVKLAPAMLTWGPEKRTALAVARHVQQAWLAERAGHVERAKLAAIQGLGDLQLAPQGPVQGQQQQQPKGAIVLRGGNLRTLAQDVGSMDSRQVNSLVRVLVEKGYLPVQPLMQQEPALAAVGRVQQAAVGGYGQPRGQQGGAAAGSEHSCTCVVMCHRKGVVCWIANPRLAKAFWKPPLPGDRNYAAYVEGCARDGIPVGGVVAGLMPVFPAALFANCEPVEGLSELAEPLGAAAAATRAVTGATEGQGRARRPYGIEMEVLFTLGRDKDLVLTVLERAEAGGCSSPGLVAAMAAGMFSFGGEAAHKVQLQHAEEWAEGKVMAKITLLFPRDEDVLQQLLARNALVRCAMQEEEPVLAAVAAGSPLAELLATFPQPVRQLYLSWRENEGGLVFFRNASLARGAALVTPDGRVFLSTEFMVDSACQMPAMSKKFGDAMGQHAVEVSPVLLRMANGELCRVTHQYKGMTVVLAKGTDQEASCELDFWCVPGLERLADAILPTVADHQFAGAGVDRVLQVYKYRPGFASEGSLEVAELPVVCHRRPQSHTVLAPVVPTTAPVGQPAWAARLNAGWAGGVFRFANESQSLGAAVVTPSGQVLLPEEFMLDSACVCGAMDEAWALAAGMEPVQVPEEHLRLANGAAIPLSRQFQGVRVVLAMGTNREASCVLDFWCVPGLSSVAQVILPAEADHRLAGAGVDRVSQQYLYRPRFGVFGDLAVAALPVTRHEPAAGVPLLAVGAPLGAVYHGAYCVLREHEARELARGAQHRPLLAVDRPHESFESGGTIDWSRHRLYRRLQFAQYDWGKEQLLGDTPARRFWERLSTVGSGIVACDPPANPPYDWFTQQPRHADGDLVLGRAPAVGVLGVNRSLLRTLCEVDGYAEPARLWTGLHTVEQMTTVSGDLHPGWVPRVLRPDVQDFLDWWVDRWLDMGDRPVEVEAPADDSSASLEVSFGDQEGSGSLWTSRWHLLYGLWEIFEAPQPVAEAAAAAAGLLPGPNLCRAVRVQKLVQMVTAGLQTMQLALRLRPTGDAAWDLCALQAVRQLRNVLATGVTEWAQKWQRRHQGLGDPAAEMQTPPEYLGEASGLQQRREPRVRPVPGARRPRVTALRQLLLLLLSLLLVVSCLGCVGAVPVHQPRGGTFRCQPG
jgi:hypothetical protein